MNFGVYVVIAMYAILFELKVALWRRDGVETGSAFNACVLRFVVSAGKIANPDSSVLSIPESTWVGSLFESWHDGMI
jgi:hypothetical protein